MKIEVLKDAFQKGLIVTEKIIGRNLTLPILENILIKTEKNFLNLTSTNLETAIQWWVLAKIQKEGKTTIPARFLSSFISLLPEEKINIESRDGKLLINCGEYETQIQSNDPEEFPLIPEIKNDDFIEVENKSFCDGLAQLVEIVAPSQTRPEISGIYFSFSKDNFQLVATDSFRLAEKTIPLKQRGKRDYSFILPQKPARELISILSDKKGKTKIYLSPNQVLFEYPMEETDHPQVQVMSRLIEGEYPDYQEIIPKKFKTTLVLKKEEFTNQIKAAALFSGKINEVKLKVYPKKKKIEILAQDPDVGESKSSLPVKVEGEPLEISYNHKFLLDGLSSIKSSEVEFKLSGEDGPSLLKPVGDSNYIYIVMPIKTS